MTSGIETASTASCLLQNVTLGDNGLGMRYRRTDVETDIVTAVELVKKGQNEIVKFSYPLSNKM